MIDPVLIEQLADAAWPAAEQAPLGAWKLRATHGVTRRANSVFTAGDGDASAAELIKWVQAAEAFYSRRSLPAVFQISAATGASGLDALLANRGYGVSGVSEVWTLETRTFTAKQVDDEWPVRRSHDPDAAWFDCAFDEIAERRRVHEQIVRRAPQPRLFVSASATDGAVVGCGMATSARGHGGIFCMATRTTHRRRGVGLALVRELCAWAVEQADQRIFLQVMTENEAAKQLYRRVGFEPAYRYHYRVR